MTNLQSFKEAEEAEEYHTIPPPAPPQEILRMILF